MSFIRESACGQPGPYDSHCSLDLAHDYSCYDAGNDVSFNNRQDFEHDCHDPSCKTPRFVNEGD